MDKPEWETTPGLRTDNKYKWDRRSVLESTAVEGDSPVIEILHVWVGIQSTTGHVKPRGKQGGPPSNPKYSYRPIAHSTVRER